MQLNNHSHMNHNINIINMKKIYIRNKDMCFFYYRQRKYRKGTISPESSFRRLQVEPSPGFVQSQAFNKLLP